MKRNLIETVFGAVVLAVAAFFLVFAYTSADLQKVEGYVITAAFSDVGNLPDGADVRLSGVKIGTVLGIELNDDYQAVVRMSIKDHVQIGADSAAAIESDGLLGDKYLSIKPDFVSEALPHDGTGQIFSTAPAFNLEREIGKFIFGAAGNGDKG